MRFVLLSMLLLAAECVDKDEPDDLLKLVTVAMKRLAALSTATTTDDFVRHFGSAISDMMAVREATMQVAAGVYEESEVTELVSEAENVMKKAVDNQMKGFYRIADILDAQDTKVKLQTVTQTIDMMEERFVIVVATNSSRFAVDRFLKAYESEQLLITDLLHANIFNGLGKDDLTGRLLRATYRHPKTLDTFIRGITVLMVRSHVLELLRNKLIYKPETETDGVVRKKTSQMRTVLESLRKIHWKVEHEIAEQVEQDQERFQKNYEYEHHCELAKKLGDYLSDKYSLFDFGVIMYDNWSTSKRHASALCQGSTKFHVANRNSVVVIKSKKLPSSKSFPDTSAELLRSIPQFQAQSAYATALLGAVRTKIRSWCRDSFGVAVIDTRAHQCSHVTGKRWFVTDVKSVYKCKFSWSCWPKFVRFFDVYIFG